MLNLSLNEQKEYLERFRGSEHHLQAYTFHKIDPALHDMKSMWQVKLISRDDYAGNGEFIDESHHIGDFRGLLNAVSIIWGNYQYRVLKSSLGME